MSIRDEIRAEAEAERAERTALEPVKRKPAFLMRSATTPVEEAALTALLSAYDNRWQIIAAFGDDRVQTADDIAQSIGLMGGASIRLAISGDSPSLSEDDIAAIFEDLNDRVVIVELGDEAPTTFVRFMNAMERQPTSVIFVCDSMENHLYRLKPLNDTALHFDTTTRRSN